MCTPIKAKIAMNTMNIMPKHSIHHDDDEDDDIEDEDYYYWWDKDGNETKHIIEHKYPYRYPFDEDHDDLVLENIIYLYEDCRPSEDPSCNELFDQLIEGLKIAENKHYEYIYKSTLSMPIGSTWTEPFGTRKNYYKWVEEFSSELGKCLGINVSIEHDYVIDKTYNLCLTITCSNNKKPKKVKKASLEK